MTEEKFNLLLFQIELFKGPQLCCGQAVDADLLKTVKNEVSVLFNSVTAWQEESQELQV